MGLIMCLRLLNFTVYAFNIYININNILCFVDNTDNGLYIINMYNILQQKKKKRI